MRWFHPVIPEQARHFRMTERFGQACRLAVRRTIDSGAEAEQHQRTLLAVHRSGPDEGRHQKRAPARENGVTDRDRIAGTVAGVNS